MKQRWLLTAWILALLSFGGAWATNSAPCPPTESCCCCSDEAAVAQMCCGCGCDVAQAPLPVSHSTVVPRDFVPFVAELPQRKFPVVVVLTAPPSPPRTPRLLDTLAGRADWRGPPALV